MIFSRDFVTRKNSLANHLVTKISLFTVTHALFFISPLYRHLCLQLRVPYAPILNTTRSLSLSLTTLLEKKILGVSTRCCIFVHHGVVLVVFHGGSVLTHCSVGHYECDIGANLTTVLDNRLVKGHCLLIQDICTQSVVPTPMHIPLCDSASKGYFAMFVTHVVGTCNNNS